MRRTTRSGVALAIAAVLVLTLAGAGMARVSANHRAKIHIPAFSTDELDALPADDWVSPAGNLSGQRHSSLTRVTTANVSGLKPAWHVTLNAPRPKNQDPLLTISGEAAQLEYQGTVFGEDKYGRVYALDAKTGKRLWYFEPHSPMPSIPVAAKEANKAVQKALGIPIVGPWAGTRGLALNDGMVFAEEQQGNVVALDANTGKLIWSHQIAPRSQAVGLSQAPLYYDGTILGATSSGDTGFPCFAFALDAKTGKLLWKFNVIPQKPGDLGWETWAHPLAFNGGGAMWATPSVDSENGLMYVSVGNPIPYMGLLRGPGQEYFTDGELALDAKTGHMKWFFQNVHHDIWDADQSQQGILYDLQYGGRTRHAIVFANKDGLWYVLDRVTGEPIIPVKEMPVQQSKQSHTWPTQPIPATDPLVPQTVPNRKAWMGLKAPDGKPYNLGPGGPAGSFTAIDATRYSVTAAFGMGASSNKPAAVDPTTGYLIEETTPGFSTVKALPISEHSKMGFFNFAAILDMKLGPPTGLPTSAIAGTRLEAMDLRTGKMVWKVDHLTSANKKSGTPGAKTPPNNFTGGVITTPGIVWASSHNKLQAFDESNGKLLWSSPTLKSSPWSVPTTFLVDGKQYVTIFCSGTGDLYAFSL
jgi:quinohemoprotein ethanol dehydrogenase